MNSLLDWVREAQQSTPTPTAWWWVTTAVISVAGERFLTLFARVVSKIAYEDPSQEEWLAIPLGLRLALVATAVFLIRAALAIF